MDDLDYIASLESVINGLHDEIDSLNHDIGNLHHDLNNLQIELSNMSELYCAFDCSSCRDEDDEPFYGNPEYMNS